MARTGRTSGRGRNSGAARNEADRIIDATLALISTEGWRRLSLSAIAAAAELPILQGYRIFHSKQPILCGFYSRIDQIALPDPPTQTPAAPAPAPLFHLIIRPSAPL